MGRRCLSGMLVAVVGLTLAGCVSGPTGLGQSHTGSLAADLRDPVARLQSADTGDVKGRTESKKPGELAAPPTKADPELPLNLPGTYKVSVRAWVNGKPLFEDEVFQGLPPDQMRLIQSLPEPQRSEKLSEFATKQLDAIIDQEVMYQDAVVKLEKANPRALEKLKTHAHQEYEKQMKRIRESAKLPEDQLRDISRLLQRKAEREFISMEYMRSRIFPKLQHAIGPREVKEYYDTHQNEFQKVERVKWQDVFLAVGPKYPTVAHAKRYAEDLIARCRFVEDFDKLIELDDGDSKFRGGEGFGSRRGEIKPPEVEEHLFKLRDGEIGPVVTLSTGVHIIRLIQREAGGQIPLNEATQLQIRNRLRNEVADRELKRLIRELRSRAVIEIEQDS